MNPDNTFNLQEIRDRMAGQQKINRLLAFDPSEKIWQQTLGECSLDELKTALAQCNLPNGWTATELKTEIAKREAVG